MRVHDVEPELARQLHDLRGERQQVLRLAEQRVARRVHAMKRQPRLVIAQPERRFSADQVHLMAPAGQRLRQLGGDDAAASHRRVADDGDVHESCFSNPLRTTGSGVTMPSA